MHLQQKCVLATSLPHAHHRAKVIDLWAAEIESLSNENIDVQIFAADSLVGARKNIASVAKGNIDCAFSINPQWGKTLPIMNVTLKPYTVMDLETLAAWPDSGAAQFLEVKLIGSRLKEGGMATYDADDCNDVHGFSDDQS